MSAPADVPLLEPIEGVLAIVDHGHMTGTNKLGLLLVLLDAAAEVGPDQTITATDLAQRHLETHWEHARPFTGDTVLRQVTSTANTQTMIQIATVRDSLPAQISNRPFERARPHINPQVWSDAVEAVEAALWANPIARLQTLPGDPPPFLYRRHSRPHRIEFLPGVTAALARHAAVLRPLLEFRFARFVAHANKTLLGPSVEQQLHEHLFGQQRHMPPPPVREQLIEIQNGRCIYTHQPLTGTRLPVDHVIPWSRQRLSMIENFIITTTPTNSTKTNLLLGPEMIERWWNHLHNNGPDLESIAVDYGWPTDPERIITVTRAIYNALPEGTGLWEGPAGVVPLTGTAKTGTLQTLAAKA